MCVSGLLIAENQQHRWVKRGNLVDSRTSVTDVKFGPKHIGLILVCCALAQFSCVLGSVLNHGSHLNHFYADKSETM